MGSGGPIGVSYTSPFFCGEDGGAYSREFPFCKVCRELWGESIDLVIWQSLVYLHIVEFHGDLDLLPLTGVSTLRKLRLSFFGSYKVSVPRLPQVTSLILEDDGMDEAKYTEAFPNLTDFR